MSREVPTSPTPNGEVIRQSSDTCDTELRSIDDLIGYLGNGTGAHADIDETFQGVASYLEAQKGRSPVEQQQEALVRQQLLRHDLNRLFVVELDP